MEMWDLLDINRNKTGKQIGRGVKREKYQLHIVVVVMTYNSKGEILMTLRSPKKNYFSNLWEFTMGSILSGETSLEGAIRELKEETGIVANQNDIKFLGYQIKDDITSFFDYYIVKSDTKIEDVILQEGETCDAKWLTVQEIYSLIKENKACPTISEMVKFIKDKVQDLDLPFEF